MSILSVVVTFKLVLNPTKSMPKADINLLLPAVRNPPAQRIAIRPYNALLCLWRRLHKTSARMVIFQRLIDPSRPVDVAVRRDTFRQT
jgi:hypothetical protein